MRFKTYISKETKENNLISCLDWSNNDEVYSVSDDRQILKWNSSTRENVEIAKLPDDFIPTDLHWLLGKGSNSAVGKIGSNITGSSGGSGGSSGDSLLITSNDGRFIILNKSARVERNISAHTMAITSGRWSPDGAGLLTASEDGIIKIWSRSGMLRSTVVQSEESIRMARWSSNSNSIVFTQGSYISVKPLAANSKLIKWRAHDGLVLCISWSIESSLIASGGEDLRYKIWNPQGTNIYISATDDFPITSVEFSPYHNLLTIGSFNMLKLCSNSGWSYNISRFTAPAVGSIYGITWSPDGTQVACGTSKGHLVFGSVIEKQLVSRNLKATTKSRKTISLQDILSGTMDALDFAGRIINFALGFGHLLVATSNQIHIFNENYINTPIIIDGRSDVRIIQPGRKFFLIVDFSSIWIYTYTGRLHLNPRYPGFQAQIPNLSMKTISLGMDILTIRDFADPTIIYVFDLIPGATKQNEARPVQAKAIITEVSSCRAGTSEDQYFVLIDCNRELYICSAARNDNTNSIHKIGSQVLSVMWSSDSNILVGLHDSSYSIWYSPGEACTDPTLIALTTITMDSTEFGKNVIIESFEGPILTFRSSGTAFTISVNTFCEIMHKAIMDGQWQRALKICRFAQNIILWATLAALATKKNQLEICEEAYSAALQIDKVTYLQHIKELPPSSPQQMAENSLMFGRLSEAETILLHNKKFKELIALHIRMHNWKKALENAEKNKIDLDLVLSERRKHLKALGKEETETAFLKYSDQERKY